MKLPVSFSIALAACLIAVASSKAQPSPTKSPELTPAEKWVLDQVAAGRPADLSELFPEAEKEKRKLTAHFLENLLAGTIIEARAQRNFLVIVDATIEGTVNLRGAQIPWDLSLNGCEFTSAVTFFGVHFLRPVSFRGTTFKQDANFSSAKFEGHAFFRKTVFGGSVNFSFAEIIGNLEADDAQFKNPQALITFNTLKVKQNALFRRATFDGTVNFEAANIGISFDATGARFNNKEEAVKFSGIEIGRAMHLENTIFEGSANFNEAQIRFHFQADGAEFRSENAAVLNVKCGGDGFFAGVRFSGPADFTASHFRSLGIGAKERETPPIRQLFLSNVTIRDLLIIRNVSIQELIALSLKVEGSATFTDVTIQQEADLSYSNFTVLDLARTSWPTNNMNGRKFRMQGIGYKYIRLEEDGLESRSALLNLVGQSGYAADVYNNLEEFFLRQGYREDADRAFIARKRRERNDLPRWRPAWLGSLTLDLLVGYGRHPWQAGVPCVFFVALGCLLFSREKMERQKPEELKEGQDPLHGYSRLWYSLGLFLPFVDLKSDRIWKPKDERWFLRHYMRVHILLGWVLIPVLLAAISGLIK
ncbi:MAG TPA: pentapeptide repeat-containing protein [Chthoniobacterales bacterium]|nr:pentapeptide repeat-containing protein [Chthoniobacterales bacterium]